MSKKLKRCVRKVDNQKGKSKSDAYAICNASINKESMVSSFSQFYSEAKIPVTPSGYKDIEVDIVSQGGEPVAVYHNTDKNITWRAGGLDSVSIGEKLLLAHEMGSNIYPIDYPPTRSNPKGSGYILHIMNITL